MYGGDTCQYDRGDEGTDGSVSGDLPVRTHMMMRYICIQCKHSRAECCVEEVPVGGAPCDARRSRSLTSIPGARNLSPPGAPRLLHTHL